ncbi:hypothetical protein GYA19_01260 [Candidatus Beckwithbacteria bacterium]|nr:hypothetical protein [Candidatus Beckwithbacteria bacterium]
MKMKNKARIITPLVILVAFLLLVGGWHWYKSFQDRFAAPRKDASMIKFTVRKENTIMAVTGNLTYYGLVKDEEALKYALKHTKQKITPEKDALKIGNNAINTQSVYEISQSMTAWQIADILLNKGIPCNDRCESYIFFPELLPGGDISPTLQERMRAKYSWVKTFEDCVKAIGHDGGQVTSKETSKRTGHPRVCNTTDGRYFVEGKEGWTTNQPYP